MSQKDAVKRKGAALEEADDIPPPMKRKEFESELRKLQVETRPPANLGQGDGRP